MAVLADRKLAGSGIADTVEKLPVFCPTKLAKPAPDCVGTRLTSERDTAPGCGPGPTAALIAPIGYVRVTVVGLPPLTVKFAALNPPAAPFASRRPFVIAVLRMRVP